MAENTEEEQLESSANIQAENPAIEITSTKDAQVITPNQEIENMEVHHAHHPTHKKKWSEYLLEFFMLFLAVFLGFLVENYREHKVEQERTEKHVHTMVENLKYDTTRYGSNLRVNLDACKGLDSFRHQINEAINNKVDANRLYYFFWKYGNGSSTAVPNASAMTQLKSSGMLRMIKNDSLVAQMGDYYERMYHMLDVGVDALKSAGEKLNDTYSLFFSLAGSEELMERDTIFMGGADPVRQKFISGILNRNPPLELYTADKEKFKQLYDAVARWELALHSYDSRLRYCQKGADSLMKQIKQTYDIE
jgi:hypothetical protein